MKSNCEFCQIVEEGSHLKVYEDEKVLAILNPKPASPGHILVFPRKHYPIIENVPDYEVAYIFRIANKISVAAFESLGMQGTNIIVNNGVAAGQKHSHFAIDIIPRRENDNLILEWEPKKLDEEEMSTVELKLKEQTKEIGSFEKEEEKPVNIDKKTKKISASEEENYLIRQLRRIP